MGVGWCARSTYVIYRGQMKRTNIHLSERQRERLHRLAEYVDLNAAEIVRRALDRYLDEEEAKLGLQPIKTDK